MEEEEGEEVERGSPELEAEAEASPRDARAELLLPTLLFGRLDPTLEAAPEAPASPVPAAGPKQLPANNRGKLSSLQKLFRGI